MKDLKEVEQIANDLLQEYELSQKGWTFKFDQAKKRLGLTDHRKKIISLSKPITEINMVIYPQIIITTIKHEIAHVLTRLKYGHTVNSHGKEWQEMCKVVGIKPEVRAPLYLLKPKGYVYVCPHCGKEHNFYRKLRVEHACYSCCIKHNNGQFDDKFILKLKQ